MVGGILKGGGGLQRKTVEVGQKLKKELLCKLITLHSLETQQRKKRQGGSRRGGQKRILLSG